MDTVLAAVTGPAGGSRDLGLVQPADKHDDVMMLMKVKTSQITR